VFCYRLPFYGCSQRRCCLPHSENSSSSAWLFPVCPATEEASAALSEIECSAGGLREIAIAFMLWTFSGRYWWHSGSFCSVAVRVSIVLLPLPAALALPLFAGMLDVDMQKSENIAGILFFTTLLLWCDAARRSKAVLFLSAARSESVTSTLLPAAKSVRPSWCLRALCWLLVEA